MLVKCKSCVGVSSTIAQVAAQTRAAELLSDDFIAYALEGRRLLLVASQFDLLVRFSRIGKQRDIADRFLSGVLNIGLRICMAHATRDSIECERGSDSYCGSLGFVDQ